MWKLYSFGMYVSSVIVYILIRSMKKKVHSQVINFFMFLPGALFLLAVGSSMYTWGLTSKD